MIYKKTLSNIFQKIYDSGMMMFLLFVIVFMMGPCLPMAHATCYEINMSTCVGDFAAGGDFETSGRLLGNNNTYYFGIIQGAYPRILVSSGTRAGGYSKNVATPTTAGYVGIWTDGIYQWPQYHLDVWGLLRSTDSAYLATSVGGVGIGITTSTSKLDVYGGSVTIRGPGAGLSVEGPIYSGGVLLTTSTATTSTSTKSYVYDLVIGTSPVYGADIIGTTAQAFNAAISTLCGPGDLTYCGKQVTIFVQPGVYTVIGATIPRNVTFVFSPGAEVRNNSFDTMFLQYGKTIGMTTRIIEPSGATKGYFIRFKNEAVALNMRISSITCDSTSSGAHIFQINQATGVIIDGLNIINYNSVGGNGNYLFEVTDSTNIYFINGNYQIASGVGAAGDAYYKILSGHNIIIKNNKYDVRHEVLYVVPTTTNKITRIIKFDNNEVLVNYPDIGSNGVIDLIENGADISTGTSITNNYFMIKAGAASGKSLISVTNGSNSVYGIDISNNKVTHVDGASTLTFITIGGASTKHTIIKGNYVSGAGTFLSDSGTSTKKATLGNFLNDVQQ